MDEARAARIKAAAAHAGKDVSSYMSSAALEAVERDERVATAFADIDRRIADSEKPTPMLSWPPPAIDDRLSADEQTRIVARWDALLGAALTDAA